MSMKKTLFGLATIFGVLSTDSMACVRTDLEDLPPEEVVARSLHLAQQGDYSQVTGAIIVRTENDVHRGRGGFSRYGTGVALDRYTVITTAHFILEKEKAFNLQFLLHPNYSASQQEDYYNVSAMFPHPTFSEFESTGNNVLNFKEGKPYQNDVPLEGLTYPIVDQVDHLNQLRGFLGVDLIVLKLARPLPQNLVFPEILPLDYNVEDTYGSCLGYGRMYYNDQNCGPVRVIEDQAKSINRHLISSKVTAYTSVNKGPILFANYTGFLVNGENSFIPAPDMLKTEGMPVGGDSGGPIFIQHDGRYKLVGINSYEWSVLGSIKLEPEVTQMLKGIVQPKFSVWVDIRAHMEDISNLMGEMENVDTSFED